MALELEKKAIALNHGAIVVQKPKTDIGAALPSSFHNKLTIMQPSSYDDSGGYDPAESIMLYGDDLMRLRDALNDAFPPQAKNLDLIEILAATKGMAIKISHPYYHSPGSDATSEAIHSAVMEMNAIGKVFYDRGFAVVTERGGFTIEATTK